MYTNLRLELSLFAETYNVICDFVITFMYTIFGSLFDLMKSFESTFVNSDIIIFQNSIFFYSYSYSYNQHYTIQHLFRLFN
jgi:hypothetical protein